MVAALKDILQIPDGRALDAATVPECCELCRLCVLVPLPRNRPDGEKFTYECHAAPPGVVTGMAQNLAGQSGMTVHSFWPPTRPNNWCAAFKPVPKLVQAGEDDRGRVLYRRPVGRD